MNSNARKRLSRLLFSFEGRIGRGEYWVENAIVVVLFLLALIPVFLMVPYSQVMIVGAGSQKSLEFFHPALLPHWVVFGAVFVLGNLMSAAVHAKRFHDLDKSGWYFFYIFTPYLSARYALYDVGFAPGDQSTNTYGPPAAAV